MYSPLLLSGLILQTILAIFFLFCSDNKLGRFAQIDSRGDDLHATSKPVCREN